MLLFNGACVKYKDMDSTNYLYIPFYFMFYSSVELGVDSFYDEIDYYEYTTNRCHGGHICGHYTQVSKSSGTL